MKEVRWHARAGQGAKTASQLLALALLRAGKFVQAFPEYGPERRGAPMRAYTRVDDHPIRRHDPVAKPDLAVVLEPSLVRDALDGLAADGVLLLNSPNGAGGDDPRIVCVPATHIAESSGSAFANVVMVGAAAAALGQPALEDVQEAAAGLLGAKAGADRVRAAVEEGFRCLS